MQSARTIILSQVILSYVFACLEHISKTIQETQMKGENMAMTANAECKNSSLSTSSFGVNNAYHKNSKNWDT